MTAIADHAFPSTADESRLQEFIRDHFVQMFVSQTQRAQVGLLGAALIVAFIWQGRSPPVYPALWMAAVVAITVWRFLKTRDVIAMFGKDHCEVAVVFVLAINGVLMAIPLVAFGRLSELERTAVAIVLLGSATASIATTAGYKLVFLAFGAPMLIPLAIVWAAIQYDGASIGASLGLGFLITAYLVFLVGVARQAHVAFEESARFRYGREHLNRELQAALASADEANRAKTRFLAVASHDLRQPVHSMNALVATLKLRLLDDQSREIVDLLDSVNQTISRHLESLLDISKLDAGAVEPVFRSERLDRIVRSHHDAMTALAAERGLRLELVITEPLSVNTDAGLFGRVMSNLTDNAFKYTRRGDLVRFEVRREGGNAVFEIADTGIGIAAEEHQRIFREFYQVRASERDRTTGLGLGLSIVQRLSTMLGLGVSLHSELGRGTTISLSFALDNPVETERAVIRPTLPPGLVVLLVDDECMVRESMRTLLAQLGCVVHLASGVDQAASLARTHRIDVLITDQHLRDGESGVAALAAVRRIVPDVPAAMMTGDITADRIREAQTAGVPLFYKPFNVANLFSVLQQDHPG